MNSQRIKSVAARDQHRHESAGTGKLRYQRQATYTKEINDSSSNKAHHSVVAASHQLENFVESVVKNR